mmetsp:Transcript_19405/g.23894  ORF Transcript_19405/g.23894 Transcript_19405/m.23894 type:complete len:781 (+) Transcript_19405:601-2943(+)
MKRKRQFEQTVMASASISSYPITSEEQPRTPQRIRKSHPGLTSIPPSPCATSTTSSPATNRSIDSSSFSTKWNSSNHNKDTSKSHHHVVGNDIQTSTQSIGNKIIPPSPSRAVLDPHYASRLYNSTPSHGQTQYDGINDAVLMPPPGIYRGKNVSTAVKNISTGGTAFSTPVHSMASDTDHGAINSSSSMQFFTPERPGRRSQMHSPSGYSSSVHSASLQQGYYTPQQTYSPASKYSVYYSPNATTSGAATPSRNKLVTPKKSNIENEIKYSDRFIPSRLTSNLRFSVWDDDRNIRNDTSPDNIDSSSSGGGASPTADTSSDIDGSNPRQDGTVPNSVHQAQQQPLLNALLRSELLGENINPATSSTTTSASSNSLGASNDQRVNRSNNVATPLRETGNFLRFNQTPRQLYHGEVFRNNTTSVVESFNISPVGTKSRHRLMTMPQKRKRKIAKVPFKVLDAPALADDFYLNLVDWSSQNVLAVGLGSCVYLWSACTSKVTKLCDLGANSQDSVTSVAWTQRGTHLAVGINIGQVQIWDTVKCKKIRSMGGHSARIGALSWSGATLASGSRDRLIYLRDVRVQQPFTARLAAHKQEVCGLKWSFDEPAHLASGGNDNKLLVWDIKNHRQPKHRFAEHTAAVKAIAWSPHQHGLLASGGGTADRCIRFWNALSGTPLNAIDTGSQVCNLAWSKNCNEIVSTHGYSLNQIAIWKYPTMQKVATLTGHTYRVLYLAMSPDGSTIVTGAGDETLRFWQVFPGPSSHNKSAGTGLLFPSSPGSILR